jgi:hypothetical protein
VEIETPNYGWSRFFGITTLPAGDAASDYLANQILFFQSNALPFLLMAASGIDIQNVNLRIHQKVDWTFGFPNFREIFRETNLLHAHCERGAGESSGFGSVNLPQKNRIAFSKNCGGSS